MMWSNDAGGEPVEVVADDLQHQVVAMVEVMQNLNYPKHTY